jgi:hypothetical protein
MKKQLLKMLAATAVTAIVFTACKKESSGNPTPPTPQTKVQMLTNGSSKAWIYTASADSSGPRDLDSCELDDVLNLSKDGKYSTATGAMKCGENEPYWNGTWTLSEDETKLSLAIQSYPAQQMDILELTPSVLKVRYKVITGNVITDTYRHP